MKNILYLSLLWAFVASDLSKEKAGPYDIVGVTFNHCDDEGTNDVSYTLKNKKLSTTTTAILLNMTFKIAFGDNLDGKILLDQYTNNGWKNGFYKYDFNKICTSLETYAKGFYNKLVKSMGKGCPLSPGNYTMEEITLDNLQLPMFPTFFYNKYRMTVDFFDKNVKVGCMAVYGDLIPKKRKTKG